MPRDPHPLLPPWDDVLETQALADTARWGDEQRQPQAEAIAVASVWQMTSPAVADAALSGARDNFVYRRDGHPNERSLRTKLAALHDAADACMTAQGMSALSAVALTTLQPGSEVWLADELYGKTAQLFNAGLQRWGIKTVSFNPLDENDLQRLAASKSQLVVVETLSNPRLRVPDIKSLAQATHGAGGLLLVDNTFATHMLCKPLTLGADFVVESLSKQVNGHSDAMLGMVCSDDEQRMRAVGETLSTFGLASSPLDCYLTHRGLMTLAVRIERACQNAARLASSLQQHPAIELVDYPGLEQNHEISSRNARSQLTGGFGWMLTFHIEPQRESVAHLFNSLQPEIAFAPSLGDVRTTVSHPATTSHRGYSSSALAALGISEGTIRVSCGLEPADWLIKRFGQALEQI